MRLKPVLVTALILACSTAFADDALQPFMPYNVEPFVDSFGSRWDFREDGSVNDGTRGCFDGAFEYEIQQVRVRFMFQKQARMGMMRGNAAGGLWNRRGDTLIYGALPLEGNAAEGVQLTRYVSLTPDKKWIRYIDLFENKSDKERTIPLIQHHDLGSGVTEQKTSLGGAAIDQEKDWAVALNQGAGRPGFVYVWRAKGQRSFQVQTEIANDHVTSTYTKLIIPRGKSVAIANFGAQTTDYKAATSLLGEFKPAPLLADLAPELRRLIVNLDSGMTLEGLDLSRDETRDTIVLSSDKTILGEILATSLTVKTVAGPQSTDIETLLGLQTRGSADEPEVLLGCRDRQIYSGKLQVETIPFRLEGGQTIEVKINKIKSLSRRSQDDEALAAKIPAPLRVLRLRTGDVLGIEDFAEPVELMTRFGKLQLKLADIRELQFEDSGNWAQVVVLNDGSRFGCLVTNKSLGLRLTNSKSLAEPVYVPIRVDMILSIQQSLESPNQPAPAGSYKLELRNGDHLSARLKSESLSLQSEFGRLGLATRDLREGKFADDGHVDLVQWNGTQLEGRLEAMDLLIEVQGLELTIPVSLLRGFVQTSFKLPAALEETVMSLVIALDAAAFEERDRAEATLIKLGQVVRPYLNGALSVDTPPEKARRIQQVLKALGPEDSVLAEVDLKRIEGILSSAKDEKSTTQASVVRALRAILAAQKVFHDQDRDKNDIQDFGTLADLGKLVGEEAGIDAELAKGSKYGYIFETGPSSNEKAAEYLWWAVAKPEKGEGPHYYIHHSGTVFVSDSAAPLNKETCDPPASARRLAE